MNVTSLRRQTLLTFFIVLIGVLRFIFRVGTYKWTDSWMLSILYIPLKTKSNLNYF